MELIPLEPPAGVAGVRDLRSFFGMAKGSEPITYFTDAKGVRWRVHDCLYRGKAHPLPMGDPRANCRYFIAETKETWLYNFERGDSRAFDEATLAKYRRGAGWVSGGTPWVHKPPYPR